MAYGRIDELLKKVDIKQFTPPIFVSTQGTERSMREDVSGTITTRVNEGNNFLIVEDTRNMNKVQISQATRKGYIECEVGGVFDASYPNSKTRMGRVQEDGKICPTLTTGSILYIEENEKKEEPKILSYTRDDKGKVLNYHTKDVANAIHASRFETTNQYAVEPIIAAMRGRNPENPSERNRSNGMYRQRLEIGGEVSNTLTSVQKDNLVVEPFGVSVHPFSHKLEFKGEQSIKLFSPALRATD